MAKLPEKELCKQVEEAQKEQKAEEQQKNLLWESRCQGAE